MCREIAPWALSNIKLGTTTDHPAGHTDSPSPASRMPRRTQEETPGRSEVSPHPPGAWPSQGWGRSPGNTRTCIESKANPSNPEGTDNVSCCSKGPGAPTKRRQAHPRGCRPPSPQLPCQRHAGPSARHCERHQRHHLSQMLEQHGICQPDKPCRPRWSYREWMPSPPRGYVADAEQALQFARVPV